MGVEETAVSEEAAVASVVEGSVVLEVEEMEAWVAAPKAALVETSRRAQKKTRRRCLHCALHLTTTSTLV